MIDNSGIQNMQRYSQMEFEEAVVSLDLKKLFIIADSFHLGIAHSVSVDD
jgi:hypothetical protein